MTLGTEKASSLAIWHVTQNGSGQSGSPGDLLFEHRRCPSWPTPPEDLRSEQQRKQPNDKQRSCQRVVATPVIARSSENALLPEVVIEAE